MDHGLSFIVCAYNAAARLDATLAALLRAGQSASVDWEVVVVDNASTDATPDLVEGWVERFPYGVLRLVEENRPGLAQARIMGVKSARYALMSFIDDDNTVAEDWVAVVMDVFSRADAPDAIGSVNRPGYPGDVPDWISAFESMLAVGESRTLVENRRTAVIWGAGFTARTEAVREVMAKPFLLSDRSGTALTGGNDREISYRLSLLGYTLRHEPRLQLVHRIDADRLNWRYFERLARGNGVGQPMLVLYQKAVTRGLGRGAAWSVLLGNALRVLAVFCRAPHRCLASRPGCPHRLRWLTVTVALRESFLGFSKLINAVKTLRSSFSVRG